MSPTYFNNYSAYCLYHNIICPKDPCSSMDPTPSSQPAETNPDGSRSFPQFYYMNNKLSRLNLYRSNTRSSQNQIINPPIKDIHLQVKPMTVSVDSDISEFLVIKPLRKAKGSRISKEEFKEDVKKSAGGSVNGLKKGAIKEGVDSQKLEFVKGKNVQKDLEHEVKDLKRVSFSLGRRRSFCRSQVELADVLPSCGVKIVSVDLPPFMQIHAVDSARKTFDSLEKFTAKTLALTLKKEFDGFYGPAWHCIVGASFGSFVTYSSGGFIYFSLDQKLYILLFKTTVQRAN